MATVPPVSDTPLDYDAIAKTYPWLFERNLNCILSPDSDGLLCGLLMSHLLGWQIKGYYDGKILLAEEGINPKDCVFLDMEVFRPHVRSVGQHMVLYNRDKLPPNWQNFSQALSGNNIRGFDFRHNFRFKFPLATIHLLLTVLYKKHKIDIPISGLCPLIYTDGAFKNMFNYPENCLNWFEYLGADDPANPLHQIFFNKHYTVSNLMIALREFFDELNLIAGVKRGDKIKISNGLGDSEGYDYKTKQLDPVIIESAEQFLQILADKTSWEYKRNQWYWGKFDIYKFQKGSTIPTLGRYTELMAKNPLSLAMTSSVAIEYSLDPEGHFD